jgi:large subunit ribosomal protein L22
VLRSAVSNAETNPNLNWHGDDLVVAAVYVDEGPTIKRWRARARGRVARIRKRTCHITIKVALSPDVGVAAAPKSEPKRAPAKRASAKRAPTTRKKKEATA